MSSLPSAAYASFEEWNPRKEIAQAARGLYGHPDNLEVRSFLIIIHICVSLPTQLYVGMQAEEAKPIVDGAGLCPGYTISRAILADAVALTCVILASAYILVRSTYLAEHFIVEATDI